MKQFILSIALFASFGVMAQETTKKAATKAAKKAASKAANKAVNATPITTTSTKIADVAPPPPPPPPPLPLLGPMGGVVDQKMGANPNVNMPMPPLPGAPVLNSNDLPAQGNIAPMAPMAPAKPAAPSIPLATSVKFTSEVIDMGKIPQNKPVTVDFVFQNIGKTPLVVENASGSCGCTVPTKPETPILSKKSDKVSATYNAASMGAFTKTVTVKFAGIDEAKVLTIKGEVVAAQ